MLTLSAHQQSLADVGSATHPLMLERGSYIPWASRFRRYLNRKRETRKFLNRSIDKGQKIIQGTELSNVDRETRFKNEFDQFTTEPGESLVLVYNRFSQLMNDLKRNKIKPLNVTINTKFLNCLRPKWYKYVTNFRLARNIRDDPFDELFDYLQQYEKLVNASRAKKLEKSHDPFAVVAHTSSSSSRSPQPYYFKHLLSVVDYVMIIQGDTFQNDQSPHHFCKDATCSCNHSAVNIQRRNVGNDGRIPRRSYNIQEESTEGSTKDLKQCKNGSGGGVAGSEPIIGSAVKGFKSISGMQGIGGSGIIQAGNDEVTGWGIPSQ
ncbi:hypothetical protein Tco_0335452 [Tanacetum coccineum]